MIMWQWPIQPGNSFIQVPSVERENVVEARAVVCMARPTLKHTRCSATRQLHGLLQLHRRFIELFDAAHVLDAIVCNRAVSEACAKAAVLIMCDMKPPMYTGHPQT
jgi:hypothetical protein